MHSIVKGLTNDFSDGSNVRAFTNGTDLNLLMTNTFI